MGCRPPWGHLLFPQHHRCSRKENSGADAIGVGRGMSRTEKDKPSFVKKPKGKEKPKEKGGHVNLIKEALLEEVLEEVEEEGGS